ncbi:hypothetical protein ACSXDM_15055 (plasmid) [Clostridium perfringens]|uniref:hypothetical protein n=1 Tax=Clostridium perfringens TaxID=1502 RepID=UPI0013E38564|nr:hypothetical protein [Clostridium perfringens]NGS95814.1 hypothetical protein [Clostridium perfringens]
MEDNNNNNSNKPSLPLGNYIITIVSSDNKIIKKSVVANSEIWIEKLNENSFNVDIN